jgi:tRNA(fMet)-specific endonuclease VapC
MPVSGRYLLDTSVLVPLTDGDAEVLARADEAAALYVPVIALGELQFGAEKSSDQEGNRARVDALASAIAVVPCDAQVARVYGRVKDGLRRIGRLIPENDIWIAATALRHGLILATRDTHFAAVKGLAVEYW